MFIGTTRIHGLHDKPVIFWQQVSKEPLYSVDPFLCAGSEDTAALRTWQLLFSESIAEDLMADPQKLASSKLTDAEIGKVKAFLEWCVSTEWDVDKMLISPHRYILNLSPETLRRAADTCDLPQVFSTLEEVTAYTRNPTAPSFVGDVIDDYTDDDYANEEDEYPTYARSR